MKKGGYKILDLKDYNITGLGVKIAGVHKEILDNKRKVILLSGVQINGVEFSDMFVQVIKTGTDFRLTGYSVAVDGTLSTYDFYVEDDDTVTLIEDEVEGGGGSENPMTAEGDMIIGGEDGVPERLAVGTEGQILKSVNGVPTWVDDPARNATSELELFSVNIGGN